MKEQGTYDMWMNLWKRIKAKECDPKYAFEEMQDIYNEDGRFYHRFAHVEQCLQEFDALRKLPKNPDAIEVALWFHDLCYDTTTADNEERSAKTAAEVLADWKVNSGLGEKVAELILLTKHQKVPTTIDGQVLIDCDLAILGADPKKFGQYERDVQREYAWVPERRYYTKRTEILQEILSRDQVFNTKQMQEKYGKQAKRNLSMSIARMKQKLKITA